MENLLHACQMTLMSAGWWSILPFFLFILLYVLYWFLLRFQCVSHNSQNAYFFSFVSTSVISFTLIFYVGFLCGSVSWTPAFLLKRYVLSGIRGGPHEPFIADSVDFVVSQVNAFIHFGEFCQ